MELIKTRERFVSASVYVPVCVCVCVFQRRLVLYLGYLQDSHSQEMLKNPLRMVGVVDSFI